MDENASNALIMAAGILLGIMILSIGVFLFYSYAQSSSNAYKQMEATQIEQFNTNFLKYYGEITTEAEDSNGRIIETKSPILCTAHDIITIANFARENNIKYDLSEQSQYDESTYYVQIDVGKTINTKNVEKWNEEEKLKFIQDNSTINITTDDGKTKQQTKYYYIYEEPRTSNITKRVCYVHFMEYIP